MSQKIEHFFTFIYQSQIGPYIWKFVYLLVCVRIKTTHAYSLERKAERIQIALKSYNQMLSKLCHLLPDLKFHSPKARVSVITISFNITADFLFFKKNEKKSSDSNYLHSSSENLHHHFCVVETLLKV